MRLCINIDSFAVLRKMGNSIDPDPASAVILSDMAGTDSICCSLQENRKYFNENDIGRIKETVRSFFNLRIPATDEMIKIALQNKPDMVTIVPNQSTLSSQNNHLDLRTERDYLSEIIHRLNDAGISTSLLIEPEINQIKEAVRIGTDLVEINTNAYASAETDIEMTEELEKIRSASLAANKLKIGVFLGGGLNYQNLKAIASLNMVEEVILDQAVIARSSLVGLENSIKELLRIINDHR